MIDKSVAFLIGSALYSISTFSIGCTDESIRIPAQNYTNSKGVCVGCLLNHGNYGDDVVTNGIPPIPKPNMVEYKFKVKQGGIYRLRIEYAAAEPRSSYIYINDRLITEDGIGRTTGGWTIIHQNVETQGEYALKKGENSLRIERSNYFPHIRTILFECK